MYTLKWIEFQPCIKSRLNSNENPVEDLFFFSIFNSRKSISVKPIKSLATQTEKHIYMYTHTPVKLEFSHRFLQ